MAIKDINIFQSSYGPQKVTQIGIYGFKINHLTTMLLVLPRGQLFNQGLGAKFVPRRQLS
jgi:hypothetical protein